MAAARNHRGGITRADLASYARAVGVAAAAAVPGFASIIWKGSAYKPWDGPYDFFPGLSDLDVHVYRPGGVDDPRELRDRLMSRLGAAPSDTPVQLLVLDPATLASWWTVLPGTYEVLAGGPPPIPVPRPELLAERDRIGLAEAADHAEQVTSDMLSIRDDELWKYLRSLRWMFPPVLHRAASVSGYPADKVWALNRTQLLEIAAVDPELAEVRSYAIEYFEAALEACRHRGEPDPAGAALAAGIDLLRAGAAWAAARER